jgi:hypothetical protein
LPRETDLRTAGERSIALPAVKTLVTPVAIIFVLLAAFFLFRSPKRWAALPLLAGAGYMTLGQDIQVGPLHFTVIRILVAVGVVRVITRRERIEGGLRKLDWMMMIWGICAVLSSFFHKDFTSALITRLAFFYDSLGIYFLLRVFVQGADSLFTLSKIVIIMLAPIALEMASESVTGRNNFSFLGGVSPLCEVRLGKIRAQGPFLHSILAGTVGAVCWPLLLPFWKKQRNLALLGLLTSGIIVLSSKSSGPIMTAFFIFVGLCVWKVRQYMRVIRWGILIAIIALDLVMTSPVYYLLARIDLTGSSTGWHRAELIHASITHLDEWWLAGTDYTRHWMPTGVDWNKNHTDITNHYIKMGVIGGLPLMISFIGVLVVAFNSVGKALWASKGDLFEKRFMIWTLGAILFGHALTFMSVSYFDQTIVFFLLVLAAIGSLQTEATMEVPHQSEVSVAAAGDHEENFCHNC